MKFYKDKNNKVFSYAKDGSQDEFIPKDYVKITDAEAEAILHPSLTTAEEVTIAKAVKLQEIEDDFVEAESQSTDYAGFKFVGGYNSVMSIDAYVRLTKLGGGTIFSIWDINGDDHFFNEDEVNELIYEVGSAASFNKFAKKNRKVALSKAETVLEVNAI